MSFYGTQRRGKRAVEVVARLRDTHSGPLALEEVFAFGIDALPPIEDLLRGRTEVVTQPRCLAADALGLIGGPAAIDVLIRALQDALSRQQSLVLNFAEQTVASRIASNLGALSTTAATSDLLLRGLNELHLIGCIEPLTEKLDARAIPALIDCLADDYVRGTAIKSLARFGPKAETALIKRLNHVSPDESELSSLARASAAELLGEIGSDECHIVLSKALQDRQLPVRRAVAVALVRSGDASRQALELLIDSLDHRDQGIAEAAANAVCTAADYHRQEVLSLLKSRIASEIVRQNILRARTAQRLLDYLNDPAKN